MKDKTGGGVPGDRRCIITVTVILVCGRPGPHRGRASVPRHNRVIVAAGQEGHTASDGHD